MLTETEFNVLRSINAQSGFITQRDLASVTGYSLGTVNKILNSFLEQRFIDSNYRISEQGKEVLNYYKVENAIILAAGKTSGNNEISRNIPKGLYVVKGEPLIERMIKQLRDVGVKDIYVVVGFRMDQFFYLESTYGVHLITNSEYTSRNNNGSIYQVKDILGNSYIIPNDEYFAENVFSAYEYKQYYASIYMEKKTKESFIKFNSSGQITNVYKGDDSGWVMLGHCYMTREYADKYKMWLESVYNSYEAKKMFWEEIFYPHLKEYPLYVRKYDSGIIYEFDELNELQGFDNQFIDNINHDIYELICRIFNSSKEEITDVQPIYGNGVDVSFKFKVRNDSFLFRYPGKESSELFNYAIEQANNKIVSELGINNSFVFEDRRGYRISIDTEEIEHLNVDDCVRLIKLLRKEEIVVANNFDFREKIRDVTELFDDNQLLRISGFGDITNKIMELLVMVESDNWEKCFSHNNITVSKFRRCGEETVLIDWTCSGINDKGYDIAALSYGLNDKDDMDENVVKQFIAPTKEVMRHLYACNAIYHYYQFLLGIYYSSGENEYSNALYEHWKKTLKCIDKAEELFSNKQNDYLTDEQVKYVEEKIGESFVSLEALLGGATNVTYVVNSKSGKRYALRIPGKGTNEYINRKDEMANISAINSFGIMPHVICADPDTGILIMDYIDNGIPCSMEDVHNAISLQKICRLLYEVHTSGTKFNNEFDIPAMQKMYIEHFKQLGGTSPRILKEQEDRLNAWMDYLFLNYPKELAPCHIDPKLNNFMKKGRKLYLIDWEYSGMADPYFDLANFSLTNNLSEAEEKMLLDTYFKVSGKEYEHAKFLLYKFATDYLWVYWHLIKMRENDMVEYNEMSWKKRFTRAKKIIDELERKLE